MQQLPTRKIFDYRIVDASLTQCVAAITHVIRSGERRRWLACINPHSVAVAEHTPKFRAALKAADWLIPDGVGIMLAAQLLRQPLRSRITGPSLFFELNQHLNEQGSGRVFFLGSTQPTLDAIRRQFVRQYPYLEIVGTYSPPFKSVFSAGDNERMIASVNAAAPDALWVGLTSPKQDLWLHDHIDRLDVAFAAGVGAAFDFFTEAVKLPHPVVQKLGLTWLTRLVQEPRRLWRRTLISGPQFAWLIFKHVSNRDQ